MGKTKDGGIPAIWETVEVMLFCELCIKEIDLENRPTTHFSKDGWKNLVTNFKQRPGKCYDRTQMKNKWDQLKKEWKLWKELKHGETGLGWNSEKRTIDASDEWWEERLKVVPAAKKFRYTGLAPDLEVQLDKMFTQVVATGEDGWAPSVGSLPSEMMIGVEDDNMAEDPASPVGRNEDFGGAASNASSSMNKRRKIGKNERIALSLMKEIKDAAISARPPTISIKETVDLISNTTEIKGNLPLYFFALNFIRDKSNRELFMSIPPDSRVWWIKNHYELSLNFAKDDNSHDYSSDEDNNSDSVSPKHAQYLEYCNILISTISFIHDSVRDPTPCMTSTRTGDKWVREMLNGHTTRCHDAFRMSRQIFIDLLRNLEDFHGLRGSRRTTTREVLAITLYILGQRGSFRATRERFQHSSETISRYFSKGIKALLLLAIEVIKPTDRQFRYTPTEISNDDRYMPFFKNCIGAIDGTHVSAIIPVEDQVRYIGRHGTTTQNVMAVCDFNMCFTFVLVGWEGSVHDSHVFARALTDHSLHFPHPPQGKYYLVDVGYPVRTGYLKPYPDTRYHLADYARGTRPVQGKREYFNKAHSSLRSVIERTFGVWKNKWSILQRMPQYPFRKQRSIVVATMAVHNFIRRHPSRIDPEFSACDVDENFIHTETHRPSRRSRRQTEGHFTTKTDMDIDLFGEVGVDDMLTVRDSIADELYNARR